MSKKHLYAALVAAGAAALEAARNVIRSNGQKKLQRKVDESFPIVQRKETKTENDVTITIIPDDNLDLTNFKEISMDKAEMENWKSLISNLGGDTFRFYLGSQSFNGLLECNIPIKDLCRAKDNPNAMRGIVLTDGKVSKHASFTDAGLSNIAPILVYQCLAAITSQYYQHIMAQNLESINSKLENISQILTAEDKAKLRVAFNRFVELNHKTSFDLADKQLVSEFSWHVETIREKYKEILSGLRPLNIGYKWSDKQEAEAKIKALNESKYFEYLGLAMQSEALCFIASVISVKVARYLGNDEDVKIYASRINLDYWDCYLDQFKAIRHDVIKYLELESKASWFQEKAIKELMDNQIERFNLIESNMVNLQDQFNYRSIQYIKCSENGDLKKYIALENEQ